MKSNRFVIAALLSKSVSSQDTQWRYNGGEGTDYTLNGADWDLDFPGCGDSHQSPINLYTMDTQSIKFQYTVYDSSEDQPQKMFMNQNDATMNWNGHTIAIDLDNAVNGVSAFESNLAETIFGADTYYEGIQFNFHAGSEHTVNDVRLDLEMQTYHYPTVTQDNFLAGAVGVLFSVEDYTVELSEAEIFIIDTFFQSLQWGVTPEAAAAGDENPAADGLTNPVIDLITYGNLMELVDMNNRWAYKGSVTTPPCSTFVYWNVLSTVYPIKQEHLDQFKTQLARGGGDTTGDLAVIGNWREIQEIDGQDIIYISDDTKISQRVTNLFKGASTYLSVGVAAISAFVAATL